MSESTNASFDYDDVEPIFPDGWKEGDDIFADDEPNPFEVEADGSGSASAVEADSANPQESEAPTTAPSDPADGQTEAEAPTTEPTTEETHNSRLRFTARIDHEDRDVELDEADLPNLYQRAQVTDRVQQRMQEMQGTVDGVQRLAKQMGYDSADAMLQAAAANYREAEIERLVEEGTSQSVAEFIVDTRMQNALTGAPKPQTAPTPGNAQPELGNLPASSSSDGRDYQAEAMELLSVKPELVGKQLPNEVAAAAAKGKRLLAAYLDYEKAQTSAEMEKLRKENSVYRQNAEAAARAPVSSATSGGKTDTKPSDPFLDGFNSDGW